jgi:ribosomal protein S18 acetylase RimI-like enzyme
MAHCAGNCPTMNIAYFKRFWMEIDLHDISPVPTLPAGYSWVPWDPALLEFHADVKYYSFLEEIDACVFPSLASRSGCYYLMREISRKTGFLAEATWLMACPEGYCGTVQGIRDRNGLGAIQNLGIMPAHRGRGLGKALLAQALHGFRRACLGRAFLEVTAQNEAAVRLYRGMGFRCRKTVYKAVEAAPVLEAASFFEV